ncbi:MAG TPA: hypothetical protein PK708_08485 [Candidatus Competibacter sp.]|nr:hypothetical protein [Candidatus Competibacter sp.]
MYMTQQDVNNLLQFAALSAAQKLGVAESEWDPTDKLSAAVHTKNPALGAALNSFIRAYLSWFEFGERISAQGKDGAMNPAESTEHVNLVLERDATRNAFIEALKGSA